MMEFPEDEMQLHDSRAQRARSADARSAAFLSEHFSFYGQLRRIKPWTARTYLPVHSNLASFAGVRNAPPCARSSEFYSYEIDLVRLGLFVLIVLVASWHWQLLLTTLLLLVPTLGQLLRWWHKHTEYCPLDHVLSSYTHGLFVLGAIAMGTAFVASTVVLLIMLPLLRLFFLDERTVPLGSFFAVVIRFVSFCFVEELWLLSTLRRFKRRRQHRVGGDGSSRAQRAYVLYASASAIGYATAQCILVMVILTAIMEGHTIFETNSEQRGQQSKITLHESLALAGFTLFAAWFWLPLRLIASHLNVLELARRPESPDDPSICIPLPRDLYGTLSAVNSRAAMKQRLCHLFAIIKWSWGLRSVHIIQFIAWGYIVASKLNTVNVASWLVITFVCWCCLVVIATWRVRFVEHEIEPSAEAAESAVANLRQLYGFSLLDNAPEDIDAIDDEDTPSNGLRKDTVDLV